jgi:UDP-glucose/GDP-mannose dehydrogenase family, NAD binding domain
VARGRYALDDVFWPARHDTLADVPETGIGKEEPVTGALAHFRGTAVVDVIGLGYVDLPQALAFAEAGYRVLGFDIDPTKPEALGAGRSYLLDIPSSRVAAQVSAGQLAATPDFAHVVRHAAVVGDTRNATWDVREGRERVIKA